MTRSASSKPPAQAAITMVSRRRLWPSHRRLPGLAHGWQGAAWVAYQLAGAGVAVPGRVFESIGRQLAVELGRAPPIRYVGALIGCGAEAVVAAYAARQGVVPMAVATAACERVVAAVRLSPEWDVHLGLAGALLGFAEIAAVEPGALTRVCPAPLVAQLRVKLDALCQRLPQGGPTGMAHGPVGALMALESCRAQGWCRITTAQRQRWLDALTRCALGGANGALFWPMVAGQTDLGLQSWCAGTPGVALALLQCFHLAREPAYLELARGALEAMKRLSTTGFVSRTVCCGSAGYRHIFLEAYRITGEAAWLEDAAREPRYARQDTARPGLGLHQGALGIAYLTERLAHPDAYPFPGLGAASAGAGPARDQPRHAQPR